MLEPWKEKDYMRDCVVEKGAILLGGTGWVDVMSPTS
jgi:hypothetical protein